MIPISFSAYEDIARQLQTTPSADAGRFAVERYDNQELHASGVRSTV
jgi:hypothetical protein